MNNIINIEIKFLLLKRTKFVDFARRRADEGVGLKNNQWPPNIKGFSSILINITHNMDHMI